MSRDDLHFRLRIPEALKRRIELVALSNRRSMTAEIIAALDEAFPPTKSFEQLAVETEMTLNHLRVMYPEKHTEAVERVDSLLHDLKTRLQQLAESQNSDEDRNPRE
jgi:predicted transcriptional regulator